MALDPYIRVGDFSDDESSNKGGRSTVDTAQLDAELDAINVVLVALELMRGIIQRDDGLLYDSVLQGHEFSTAALNYLASALGTSAFAWRGAWANDTDYVAGNMVESGSQTYICISTHTSPSAPDTFTTGSEWELVAASGSAGLPAIPGVSPDTYVLGLSGGAIAWVRVVAASAPSLAPLASPTFTGTVLAAAMTLNGVLTSNAGAQLNSYLGTLPTSVTFAAGGNTFDFATAFQKKVTVTGNYTSACATSNRVAGRIQEILFTNTSGADAALLWNAGWTWMGYAPSTLPTGKKAILQLRTYGTAETDVVAVWSVQP